MSTDSLARRFQQQAEKRPDAVAVSFRQQSISYQELDQRSNRVAHYLGSRGVCLGDRVGICVERSIDLPVVLLGILKAGAAYVPFDSAYPEQRLQMMADDCQAKVVIVSPQHAGLFGQQEPLLNVDEINDALADFSAEPLSIDNNSDSGIGIGIGTAALTYLIYTSGSTGRPKGVAMPQRAMLNLLDWQLQQPGFEQPARTLQFTPISFDVHFQEFFVTWCSGGELVLIDDAERRDAISLLRLLCRREIERLFLPFVALQHLTEVAVSYGPLPSTLKNIVTAGEQLQISRFVREFFTALPACRLHNQYGPSETHVVTAYTLGDDPQQWEELPPIGTVITNSRIYIVNEALQPVSSGEVGEICMAGDCLAEGYWQQEEMTAERFVMHQIGEDQRLYRSGDLGKERPDGNIEYLGRIDGQIKIRGYRIETGEIETAIAAVPLVKNCVVVAAGQSATDKKLLAYLVLNANRETADELMQQLRAEQLLQWQQVWDGTYDLEPATEPEFDISGWNSSYTGDPLTAGDMRSWVDSTIQRVRALKPQRVLEIGCGTGLIMYNLAPFCDYYHATDFSPIAIKHLENHMAAEPQRWADCNVSVLTAEQMESLAGESFDTIVMNSVTQHFPGADYLLSVVRAACKSLAKGGQIFIGDVTSLSTREAFFTELELYRASSSTSLVQLRASLEKHLGEERELVIAPEFFYQLSEQFAEISSVDVQLKPGAYDNELLRFRYDVVLHVAGGKPEVSTEDIEWLDWQHNSSGKSSGKSALAEYLCATLQEKNPEIIGLQGIPNKRLQKAFKAIEWLNAQRADTVAELNRQLSEATIQACEPQDFWNIEGGELPYKIDIHWSAQPDCFDVVARRVSATGAPIIAQYEHRPEVAAQPLASYASQPLNVAVMPSLVLQLRRQLADQLPDYMLPQRYILLSRLPMTPSGKLDRRALPQPSSARPVLEQEFVPPKGQAETQLAVIWAEVLELDQVGVNDNFFDLGGNSILSVTVGLQIKLRLELELAVVTLFQYPTIRTLASYIDNGEDSSRNIQEQARTRAKKQQKAFAKRGRLARR